MQGCLTRWFGVRNLDAQCTDSAYRVTVCEVYCTISLSSYLSGL